MFVPFQCHDQLSLFKIVVRHLRRKSIHGIGIMDLKWFVRLDRRGRHWPMLLMPRSNTKPFDDVCHDSPTFPATELKKTSANRLVVPRTDEENDLSDVTSFHLSNGSRFF